MTPQPNPEPVPDEVAPEPSDLAQLRRRAITLAERTIRQWVDDENSDLHPERAAMVAVVAGGLVYRLAHAHLRALNPVASIPLAMAEAIASDIPVRIQPNGGEPLEVIASTAYLIQTPRYDIHDREGRENERGAQ